MTAFYIAAGVAVLAVSLITNYQYGPRTLPTTDWSGPARRAAGASYATPRRAEFGR